jgi:hypothetical protein
VTYATRLSQGRFWSFFTASGLRHLESLKGLRYLSLSDRTGITEADVARLRKSLSYTHISISKF